MSVLENFWFGRQTKETAAYMRAYFPGECAHVLEQAEKICRNTFVFREHWEMERTNKEVTFPGEIIWDYIPEGDPEWIYALNRHTCFLILGKAWQLTRNEKYPKKFTEMISDWMERVTLTEKSRETTWRSLECGIRIENWLKTLLLFADSRFLDEALRAKIDETLLCHGEYLIEVNNPFQDLSNWGVLQNHGLALLGLYFEKEEWICEAVDRLDKEVYMQVFGDGSQWEQSPMYHCEVLYGLLDVLFHLKQFGRKAPERLEDSIYKMLYALGYWCKPNGHIPCHGDSDDIDARDMLAMGAFLFQDERLKFLAGGRFFEDNLWNLGAARAAAYEALGEKEPEETSKVLTDAGNYMIRSGWHVNADYIRFHCGCLGSGHGHGDQLHVDYYSGGEDILIDPGRYTYVDSQVRRELKLPSGHNTVCVDGEEFCECEDSWGYSRLAYPIKGEYCFKGAVNLAMGAHLGYLEKGILVTRKVVTVEEGLMVIADVFYGRGAHFYDSYFHFGSQGKVRLISDGTDGTVRARFFGEKVRAELLALKGTAQLVKGKCSPEYNLLKECGRLKVHSEQEGQHSMFTVVSVSGQESQSISAQLIPVSRVRTGETFDQREAEAIRIVKDQREFVIIFCHQEVISQVDYFSAGGYASYGKTIVFSQENTEGICVQY